MFAASGDGENEVLVSRLLVTIGSLIPLEWSSVAEGKPVV
jgi:hypothetical protein